MYNHTLIYYERKAALAAFSDADDNWVGASLCSTGNSFTITFQTDYHFSDRADYVLVKTKADNTRFNSHIESVQKGNSYGMA